MSDSDKTIAALGDMLQLAANRGAFICPLAGNPNKPEMHAYHCVACRVRALLTPRWLVVPEEEMASRLQEYAKNVSKR